MDMQIKLEIEELEERIAPVLALFVMPPSGGTAAAVPIPQAANIPGLDTAEEKSSLIVSVGDL